MSRQESITKVLQLLAENARNNTSPEVMDSETIARELHFSLSETEQLLKMLHASGVIVSNLEGKYSLITRAGLQLLDQVSSTACHFRRSNATNIPRYP
jgi:DNA-binding IclR family transcriptional regulator